MSDGNEEEPATLRRKRRSWTLEDKRRIVDESLVDGASLAEVARRHDLNANQLFTWRRQCGIEPVEPKDPAPILPVTITSETAANESEPESSGHMEIAADVAPDPRGMSENMWKAVLQITKSMIHCVS